MIVARSMSPAEPDLLLGHEFTALRILDLDGVEQISYQPPLEGWSHSALECMDYDSVSPDGWDAYLGQQWIGSSEV